MTTGERAALPADVPADLHRVINGAMVAAKKCTLRTAAETLRVLDAPSADATEIFAMVADAVQAVQGSEQTIARGPGSRVATVRDVRQAPRPQRQPSRRRRGRIRWAIAAAVFASGIAVMTIPGDVSPPEQFAPLNPSALDGSGADALGESAAGALRQPGADGLGESAEGGPAAPVGAVTANGEPGSATPAPSGQREHSRHLPALERYEGAAAAAARGPTWRPIPRATDPDDIARLLGYQ
jgi:hypothetical protein